MTSAWDWIASIWSPIRTCTRDASSPLFGGSYPPCEFQAHIICLEKCWMLLENNNCKILRSTMQRSLHVRFYFRHLGHHLQPLAIITCPNHILQALLHDMLWTSHDGLIGDLPGLKSSRTTKPPRPGCFWPVGVTIVNHFQIYFSVQLCQVELG